MKPKRALRIVILATVLAAGAAAAIILASFPVACTSPESISTSPPTTQESVNAIYSPQARVNHDGIGKIGDTIVAGRCIESRKYAKTTKGDWDIYWYLIKVQITGIEKGRWDGGDELRFIASDSWPTPGSKIEVKKGPWPFCAGLTYAFALDTTKNPAEILEFEFRSIADPSRKPTSLHKSADENLYEMIHQAVKDYCLENNNGKLLGGYQLREQTEQSYFLHVNGYSGDESLILEIDRATMKVSPFTPTQTMPTTTSAPAISKKHEKLISDCHNWQPPKYSADFANPYYEQIVAEGSAIIPALIQSQAKATKVSGYVIRAMGQISSPTSLTFLLDAYKQDPRPDIAFAIGSSWRAENANDVFRSFNESALRNLLSEMLPLRWNAVKDKNIADLKKYILDNIGDIVNECRQRSKPILG